MLEKEEMNAWQWFCCALQSLLLLDTAVKPVANWLIVVGCQCDATQDAEDMNKHVTARLLPRKHLPCYAAIVTV